MRSILCAALLIGCGQSEKAKPVPAPAPTAGEPRLVTDPAIVKQVESVMNSPAEPATAKDLAAAKDPGAVLGEWKIRTLQSSIDGKLGEPEEPLVPGSWVLARDGSFTKTGGNELKGTFVFTGDHLVVSAIGPALDYEIKKLTKTEMVLVTRIQGVNIENTTTFDRVEQKK